MSRPVWRLIVDPPLPGARNMSVDEALLDARCRDVGPPTLRLYGWERPTVSLGRFQDPDGVDLEVCAGLGFDAVRRPTGGRGVLHDREVTYALVASVRDGIPSGTRASYSLICEGLVSAYRSLGIEAEITKRPRGSRAAACYLHATAADVSVGAAKLSGSAQVWRHDCVLQHGSVVIARDVEAEARAFRLDRDQAGSLRDAATSLNELLEDAPGGPEIEAALEAGFAAALGVYFEPDGLYPSESERSAEREATFRLRPAR